MAKLTEAEKKQIQIEYAAGASTRELAEKFSVSQTAIAKLLKNQKSFNETEKVSNRDSARDIVSKAYEALLDLRLSRAQAILQSKELNVAETAEACGFSNLSFFIRLYKKHFGHTPKKE